MALIDFFDRGWKINPKGIAFHMDGEDFNYTQIRELSCQISNALVDEGFEKETKGAVWSNNDPISWTCTLSLWRARLTWIPVNPRSAIEETISILDRFDTEIIFFQKAFEKEVAQAKKELTKVKKWICIDGSVDGSISMDHYIKDKATTPPDIEYNMDDLISISPTGGTTGPPKGVMNTNRSLVSFCTHFMSNIYYTSDELPINLAAAPMTHTAGLLTLPTTARGGKVVVLTKPDPITMFTTISQQRVTEFFLPPTVIYRMLSQREMCEKLDFSSVKYLLYGASPMSVDKLKEAIEVFGPIMCGGYGQTEAPASISTFTVEDHFKNGKGKDFASDSRLASVGRTGHLIQVEIMDDVNNILPIGETGEIVVKGDLIMKGYYKDPEKTAETIIDGWLHTGDVGNFDEDGYLYITDRKKDMIITGGFNVYPQSVEQVIWGHPAVEDCAVIGVPDEDWGEAVKAVVELKPGHTLDKDELIELCKDKLGSVKTPKTIDVVDELPRSLVGKVLKKDLREKYWKNTSSRI